MWGGATTSAPICVIFSAVCGFACSVSGLVKTSTGVPFAVVNNWQSRGILKWLSSTILTAFVALPGRAPLEVSPSGRLVELRCKLLTGRAVNSGSSARTVFIPTNIAPARRRKLCVSFLLCSFEIHCLLLSPAYANLPSMLCAHFNTIQHLPVAANLIKGAFSNFASASQTPICTSIPALRNCSMPLPAACSDGSIVAMTTFVTPAAIIASVQGAVLP